MYPHAPAPSRCQLINKAGILNARGASASLHHESAEPCVGWALAQHVDAGLVAAPVLQVHLVQLAWWGVEALVVDKPGGLQC